MKDLQAESGSIKRRGPQQRGIRTREALLDAAEALIAENGIDGASIIDVAKKAKSSVGSVYHHFEDKRDIVRHLYSRMIPFLAQQDAEALDESRWADASASELLSGYLDIRLQQLRDTSSAKAAIVRVMINDPEVKDELEQLRFDASSTLRDLLVQRSAEMTHPDAEYAVAMVVDQISALLYAATDPHQQAIALTEFDEEAFKIETLRWSAMVLGLRDA